MPEPEFPERPALAALRARRSHSRVTEEAPDREELEYLLSAMSSVSDHSALKPWRIIEIRGAGREKLGKALAKANGTSKDKGIAKAMRAPLVLAVVVSPKKSSKVPYWEQESVASAVAHYLSLLLHEAGWGTMWRTGDAARSKKIRKAHKLEKHEQLLGWIYVGGVRERDRRVKRRKPLDMERHLSRM
ncbi:nitroreductase family protein [Gulosibacter chungangensis]|uniref:Putative NAD(P)H nitroreductase n=1 Tax=Gulosibacter chungangensis TaxID=979746 RepID=A0A7J5B992_9MICO|nr:nitroreductase family protein [Gulosibacter chungangensis]KAB1642148.1 nitroreductase [Gulosibacter chungangensis]